MRMEFFQNVNERTHAPCTIGKKASWFDKGREDYQQLEESNVVLVWYSNKGRKSTRPAQLACRQHTTPDKLSGCVRLARTT